MLHKVLAAFTLVGAAAAMAGLGTFATPIATAVPTGKLHYAVSNMQYAVDKTLPLDIDTLTFDASPAIVGSVSGRVTVHVDLTNGPITSIAYQCSTDSTGKKVTCATTSPQLTVDRLRGVTVAPQ
jgi:hypothetical protein